MIPVYHISIYKYLNQFFDNFIATESTTDKHMVGNINMSNVIISCSIHDNKRYIPMVSDHVLLLTKNTDENLNYRLHFLDYRIQQLSSPIMNIFLDYCLQFSIYFCPVWLAIIMFSTI